MDDDVCSLRSIEDRFADGDIKEMIIGVVTAPDFTVRK
jgi:hypothetical protein